jgi:hypothetical protein
MIREIRKVVIICLEIVIVFESCLLGSILMRMSILNEILLAMSGHVLSKKIT